MEKVLVIANNLASFGGGERWILEAAVRLKKHFDITIVNPVSPSLKPRIPMPKLRERYDLSGINILDIQCRAVKVVLPGIGAPTVMVPKKESIKTLELAIANTNVVYVMSLTPVLVLKVFRFAKKYKKNVVMGVHNPELTRAIAPGDKLLKKVATKYYNLIQKFTVYRYTNAIHVQTESQLRFIRKLDYRKKIYYIPYFVYSKAGPKRNRSGKKELIALFVGRASVYQKGIDLLPKIIDSVLQRDRSVRFHLVGGGGEGEGILKTLEKKHKGYVKFMGFLPDDKLAKELENADIFIFPSRYETQGLALLEAQGNGLPTVAFKVAGPADIMKRKEQGTLVKPFDSEAFANAIVSYSKLYRSKRKSFDALHVKIAEEITEMFGEQKFVKDFEKMLQEQKSV